MGRSFSGVDVKPEQPQWKLSDKFDSVARNCWLLLLLLFSKFVYLFQVLLILFYTVKITTSWPPVLAGFDHSLLLPLQPHSSVTTECNLSDITSSCRPSNGLNLIQLTRINLTFVMMRMTTEVAMSNFYLKHFLHYQAPMISLVGCCWYCFSLCDLFLWFYVFFIFLFCLLFCCG